MAVVVVMMMEEGMNSGGGGGGGEGEGDSERDGEAGMESNGWGVLRPEAKQKVPTARKTGPLVGLGEGGASLLACLCIIQSITAGVDNIHRASDDVLGLGLGATLEGQD